MRKRNWLKTTIAMITLIATVLETGFTSVSTLAAEITTEDGIVVNNDAIEENDQAVNNDDELQIDVSSDSDSEYVEEDTGSGDADQAQEETYEEAEELKDGTLNVSDSGITGSGYDEISVYVDTEGLKRKDRFRLEFEGPASASYNPVLNEDLDKTNSGRYDFDSLEGGDFSVRATSSDDVILSYKYNEDGYPTIVVESAPAEKVLSTRTLNTRDDEEIAAISGEGYDSVRIRFNTEELSDKASFKLYVDTNAKATVDGSDATEGITLDNRTSSVTIEDLEEESFEAYVISDNDEIKIKTVADVDSVEDGEATFTVDNENVKRVYEYEDAKVKVTATLEKADAIPDDAYFCVTPLTEEEAQKYIEALNASLEEGQPEVTADDILLYDIAFYTDESKEEEIEPEEGSVSISIEFKKNQVSEELGVEDEKDVNVTHFEENGKDIEPVTVDVEQTYDTDSLEFSVDSFSVYGIWADSMANVKPGKTVSYSDILGRAVSYGIVANELTLSGHMETNFAVGTMHGTAQIQACRNEGNGAGLVYIGDYDSDAHSFLMDKNNNSGVLRIITTQNVLDRMDPAMKNRSGVVIDTNSMDKGRIQKFVKDMVDEVAKNSANLMKEKNCYQYASIQKDGVVDFTSKGAGTYYISFDTSEGATNNEFPGSSYTIKINDDQNVVLNIPYDTVDFGQYHLWIGDKQYTPQANSDEEILFEKLIFNCPNASSVTTSTPVTGTFIAPNATFKNNGVAAGFLVANHFKVGGSEWHTISKTIDIIEDDETEFTLDVKKILKDINGNVVDDGLWPEEGFTFKLSKYLLNDPNDLNQYDSNIIRVASDIPDVVGVDQVTIYKDTPDHKAEFGKLKFTGKSVYDDRRSHVSGSYANTKYMSFMYKIQEVKGTDSSITYNTTPVYIKFFVNSQKVTSSDGSSTKYYVWVETKVSDTVSEWRCNPGTPEVINTYNELEIPVEFKGTKKVNGNSQKVESGKFGFTLSQYSGNNTWTPIQSDVSNVGSSVTFEPIVLKKGTGWDDHSTFYFLIDETRCDSPYTEDESKFVAKVQLYMDGKQLKKSVKYYKYKAGEAVDVNNARNEADGYFFSATEFVYDNTYEANGEATFYVNKELIGRPAKDTDKFTFTLSCAEKPDDKMHNQEITISGDGDFNFNTIKYGVADIGQTYTYTIAEKKGTDNTIEYSNYSKTFTVDISDNKDGTLNVDQHDVATQAKRVKFQNIFDASDSVKFSASKRYGSGLKVDKPFTFILKGDKLPAAGKSVTVTGEDTGNFFTGNNSTVDFTLKELEDGNGGYTTKYYRYTIEEQLGDGATAENNYKGADGVTYDPHVYHILVVVSYNATTKALEKKVYGRFDEIFANDAEPDENYKVTFVNPEFTNDYTAQDTETPINGTKELTGKNLVAGQFTFKLSGYDDKTKKDIQDGVVVLPYGASVKNGEAPAATKDDFSFGNIKFTQTGVYKFLVEEDDSDKNSTDEKKNTIYSEDQYIVEIKVTYDNNGDLTVLDENKSIKKVGAEGDGNTSIKFINTPVEPGTIPLFAYKDLTGRDIEDGKFEFVIKNKADENNPDAPVLRTAKNKGNVVEFLPAFRYEYSFLGGADSKTFSYVIMEKIPDGCTEATENGKTVWKNGVYTYDGHKEYVNVTVTAEKDSAGKRTGNLIIKADNAVAAEYSTDGTKKEAWFHNKYEAKGEVEFGGCKQITGRQFTKADSGKLFADLYDAAGNLLQHKEITKDTSIFGNYGAKFDFDKITYTATGEYKYTIKESGSIPGVTNDTKTIEVTVNVVDNGDGTLTATPNMARKDICFVNDYASNNEVVFKAYKKVNGKLNANGKFNFDLFDVDANKVKETKTNGNGGLISFTKITYTGEDVLENTDENIAAGKVVEMENGIYATVKTFKITEQAVTAPYRKKAEVEYTAKAFLWIDEKTGELNVAKKYYKDGVEIPEDDANLVFENIYEAEIPVQLQAEKALTGRALPAGKFTFNLFEADGTTPVMINGAPAKASNAAADEGEVGLAVFPAITYKITDLTDADLVSISEDGVKEYAKHYVMKEDCSKAQKQADGTYRDSEGYIYDTTAYNVIVKITDDGSGTLGKDWTVYKEGSLPVDLNIIQKIVKYVFSIDPNQHAKFENKYEAEGYIQINAKKILEKKDLKPDEFTFTLTGKTEDGKDFTDTKKNAADGSVVFDKIKFTKTDSKTGIAEYTYTVTEVVPDNAQEDEETGFMVLDGIRYDKNVNHTIKVKVTDEAKGKLKVEAWVDSDTNATTSVEVDGKTICTPREVTFTNTYGAEPTDLPIGGTKTLDGRTMNAGEFIFVMQSVKTAEGYEKPYAEAVTNGEGGAISFPAFHYELDDMAIRDTNDKITGYADVRTFNYEINEVTPDNVSEYSNLLASKGLTFEEKKNVTYNNVPKTITVTVTNINGKLSATTDNASSVANFTNSYDADGTLPFWVEKKVQKKVNDETTKFSFELKEEKGAKIRVPVYDAVDANKIVGSKQVDKLEAQVGVNGVEKFNYPIMYKLEDLEKQTDGTYKNQFTYIVEELDNGNDNAEQDGGYKCTKDKYKIVVDVTSTKADGKLDIDYEIFKVVDGKPDESVGKITTMKFENEYYATGHVDIDGHKDLIGKVPEGSKFSFLLTDDKGNKIDVKPYVDETGNTVEQVNPVEVTTGDFRFHIDYTQEDIGKTYYYKVDETNNTEDLGIICDPATYFIKVTVGDKNGSGELDVKSYVKKSTLGTATSYDGCDEVADNKICAFKNEVPEPDAVIFKAKKDLTGRNIEPGEFTFTISDKSGVLTVKDKDGKEVVENGKVKKQEQHNNDGGTVVFDPIYYTHTDAGKEFKYTIEEDVKFANPHISPIKEKYDVVVKVGLNEKTKKLEFTTLIDGVDKTPPEGSVVDDIEFKNKFEDTVNVKIGGYKSLAFTGRTETDLGKYAFGLYEKDGGIVTINGKKQVCYIEPNNLDKTEFTFDELTFDQDVLLNTEGSYETSVDKYYILKELKPGDPDAPELDANRNKNVMYSTKEYVIKVTISYDNIKTHELKAEVSVPDANISGTFSKDSKEVKCAVLENLSFTNYADGKVVIEGEKHISGKTLGEDGTYTFALMDKPGNDGKAIRIDETGKVVAKGGKEQIVTNKGESFNFDPIHFDRSDAGEHFFYVKETLAKDGSAVDTKVYQVKVTVTPDGDNVDVTKATTLYGDSSDTEVPIVFDNTYEAHGPVKVPATKVMLKKELKDVEPPFEFVLIGHGKAAGEKYTAYNDADGNIEFDLGWVDQEVLKDPDNANNYLTSTEKYYTVHEVVDDDFKKTDDNVWKDKKGITYSQAEYAVVVTIVPSEDKWEDGQYKGTYKLIATPFVKALKDDCGKTVNAVGKETEEGFLEKVKALFKIGSADVTADDTKAVFTNKYSSEAEIDPPILRKEIMGRKVQVRDFAFEVKGPGLPSMKESEYVRRPIYNGVYTDKDGKEVYLDNPGEIFVGDIKYQYNEDFDDLAVGKDVTSDDPAWVQSGGFKKYVYTARELEPKEIGGTNDDGFDYSDVELTLKVYVKDNGDGTMTVMGTGNDKPWHKTDNPKALEWVESTDPAKQNKIDAEVEVDGVMKKVDIVNIFNQEGHLDIVGTKEYDAPNFKEGMFTFTLTETDKDGNPLKDENGKVLHTATATNTYVTDANGQKDASAGPTMVTFSHKDIGFLNYKAGAFIDDNNVYKEYKLEDVQGLHYYTIVESVDPSAKSSYIDYDEETKYVITVDVQPAKEGEAYARYGKDYKPYLKADVKAIKKYTEGSNIPESIKVVSTTPDRDVYINRLINSFAFNNTVDAKGNWGITGKKYVKDLAGNPLVSPDSLLNQYGFALYQYKDADQRKAAPTGSKGMGQLIDEARTDEKGNFALNVIKEDEKGKSLGYGYELSDLKDEYGKFPADNKKTFFYRIIEERPSNGVLTENNIFESEGVIYDNTEYDVDVTVKFDETTGQLIVTDQKIVKAATGEEVKNVDFTNKVKEYRTVEGNKYWIDNFTDPSKRPTVTVSLYQKTASGVERKINEYKIVAPDTTYRFATDSAGNKLPTYDSAGRPYTYIVEEAPIEGYLSEKINYDFYNTAGDILIRKIDADTRAPLSGATLAIFDGSTEIERWTSGASAHVVGTQLTFGKTYTLREISAPEGYGVADDMTFTVPTDGSSITVTMSDPPIIGSARLIKRDASTRETLAGAEFALYTEAGARIFATGSAGSYTATTTTSNGVFVTDASGALTISNLPYGTYYFVETKAPEGYALSSERLGFTILRSGELVEVTYLNTKAVGSVRLRKVGSGDTRGLAGAVFELYAATPRTMGQAASSTIFSDAYYRYGTYRTNAAGEIYVGDLPWDSYYFVEVDAPDGYEVMTDVNGDDLVYTFTIGAASADRTIALGDIVNNPTETTPPPRGVLGERVKKGGVVNGVLGVRAKPNSGVLGERIGPVTGDASNIILWSLLLAACLATIVATVLTGKRKKAAK